MGPIFLLSTVLEECIQFFVGFAILSTTVTLITLQVPVAMVASAEPLLAYISSTCMLICAGTLKERVPV